ncbi:MAG: DUF2079 domain-containing protein [Clostridiales bacterium]|nr:DUF2079 domain-containing protein [Clostridiales bacterium]
MKKLKSLSFLWKDLVPKLICGWLFSGFIFLLFYGEENLDVQFAKNVNPVAAVLLIFADVLILSGLDILFSGKSGERLFACIKLPISFETGKSELKITPIALTVTVFLFSAELLIRMNSIYVYLAVALFFVLAVKYMCDKEKKLSVELSKKFSAAFVCLSVIFFAHVTMTISVLRYETYSAPNFDFGIFSNMYYHMKETFLPVSSCERDMLLSHFSVHISPILYLLLPIYAIFTSPVTIAVMQVIIIYSGIVPLYLIARKYKLSDGLIAVVGLIFSSYPAFCANCLFDFHENCFLTPLLLWMIYFYEKSKAIPMFIFAVLTLMIKEDAAVYVAVFGLYILIADKKYIKGPILTVGSIVWFFIACAILKNYGDGVMTIRYADLLNGDEGVFGIAKTVLLNPGYTVSEIFTTDEETADKLLYFAQIFIPLAFIPFCTKKYSRYILVLPVLLNLLSSFVYQYVITYQYSFGISAFLIYVTVMNLSDDCGERRETKKVLALSSAGLSVLMFLMMFFVPKYMSYITNYSKNKELYNEMDMVLSQIPEDKSVVSTAFMLPHLTERMETYELEYHDEIDTDYLVVDLRPAYFKYSEYITEYKAQGYVLVYEVEGGVAVYASPEEYQSVQTS